MSISFKQDFNKQQGRDIYSTHIYIAMYGMALLLIETLLHCNVLSSLLSTIGCFPYNRFPIIIFIFIKKI